jgi:hypothetical protein
MFENLYTMLVQKIAEIEGTYAVNRWIFLGLIIICGPPYYYSIYRLIKSVAARHRSQITFWGTMFLLASVIPYVYVLIWGENLPWFIYAFIAVLIGKGVLDLIKKMRKSDTVAGAKNVAGAKGTPGSASAVRISSEFSQDAENLENPDYQQEKEAQ